MSTQPVPRMTFEQYLEIERKAEFRSEFLDGQVFAMADPSADHEWIVASVATELGIQLKGTPCGVRIGKTRIYAVKYNIGTYPDIVVTCGPDVTLENDRDNLTDATLIVEVLSPTTQNYDRSQKFEYYRSLPSFSEYLLVAQKTMRAEHHVKQSDGSWLWREYTEPDTRLDLQSIGCHLVLKDLYARVEFEGSTA